MYIPLDQDSEVQPEILELDRLKLSIRENKEQNHEQSSLVGGVLFIWLAGITGNSEDPRQNLVVFRQDFALGQIVDGGGWKTTITLVNISNQATEPELLFIDDNGQPLVLPWVGLGNAAGLSGPLPFQGTITLETTGTASQVSQGWGFIFSDDRVAGMAVFRRATPGLPDIEAVVPFGSVADERQVLPFDHTGGYVTGVALANPAPGQPMTISFTFRDTQGVQFHQESLTMQSLTHTAFIFSQRFPQTANRIGVAEIRGSAQVTSSTGTVSYGPLVLGLRGSPSGSLTTVFPMVSPDW